LKGASRYLAVSADDVKRVAAKYLVDSNLTLVTLQPAGPPSPKGGAR
jgi:predicted Zn-dependent peptidase